MEQTLLTGRSLRDSRNCARLKLKEGGGGRTVLGRSEDLQFSISRSVQIAGGIKECHLTCFANGGMELTFKK